MFYHINYQVNLAKTTDVQNIYIIQTDTPKWYKPSGLFKE